MKIRLISRLAILCALLLSLTPSFACGASKPPGETEYAALDAYITAQMGKHGLPGVALAVTRGDEVVYLQGYGSAGGGRPLTPQTPMYIGSQSKSFTALAVAQLAEQGLIDLNAPVQTYIPWFKVADPRASQKITISHLLHHTSGLSESGFAVTLAEGAPGEELVRALASARLTAPLGARFQYFNVGYEVLAVVIAAASGQSYADYLQEHIFDPLGMDQTFTDPARARAAGLAQGYSRLFGFAVPRRQPHPVYAIGAGYLISTAADMARFAIAMQNDGVYEGTRLLSSKGMRRLFVPVQGYGLGWFVQPGHIYHGGANETFKTFVDLYPRDGLGIVLLINQGYLLDHYISAERVFAGVASLLHGTEPPPVSAGWSMKWIGWGLLALVLALAVFQARSLLSLRGWPERARHWSPARLAWDVGSHFLIPTVILIVVFWQSNLFFADRFNLAYQLRMMFTQVTDIAILMLAGSLPDYLQGFTKAYWLLAGDVPFRQRLPKSPLLIKTVESPEEISEV